MTAYGWDADPKRLVFQLARYKHVAKLLEGTLRVLEVGCADGQGARIVRQHVGHLTAVDKDLRSIGEARRLCSARWPVHFEVHDIMDAPFTGFDAVYSLDLLEHITDHNTLLRNLRASAPVAVIGTPSAESQRYASEISRAGHVNCVTKGELRARLMRHYRHVFCLGMNDETLHTGYDGMTHYLLAVAVA